MYRNIQLLRAVAAIAVLLHHARLHYDAMKGTSPVLRAVMEAGYAGVDIFFVISGFIMMHLIHEGPAYERSARSFLGRRFVRIYFWYWPWLAAAFLALWLTDGARLAQVSLWRSFTLTSISLEQLVLSISWSLTHELYFYLATALLLFVRPAWVPRIVAAVLALQLAVTWFMPYREGELLSFLASPFNVEFLLGCMLYFWKDRLVRHGDALVLALGAVLFFYLGAHLQTTPTVQRIATFGLGSFFLVALALVLEARGRFVASDGAVAVGEASYTLYLSHLVFIALFYVLGLRGWLAAQSGVTREVGFLAFLAAVVLVCVWIHRRIEMPLVRASYRRFGFDRAPAAPPDARTPLHSAP